MRFFPTPTPTLGPPGEWLSRRFADPIFEELIGEMMVLEPKESLALLSKDSSPGRAAAVAIELVMRHARRGDIASARLFAEAYDALDESSAASVPGVGYVALVAETMAEKDFCFALEKILAKPVSFRYSALSTLLFYASERKQLCRVADAIRSEIDKCLEGDNLCQVRKRTRAIGKSRP